MGVDKNAMPVGEGKDFDIKRDTPLRVPRPETVE
jgi:hypothetical protein